MSTTEQILFMPTRMDVKHVKVGELAIDCFGRMSEVVEISYRGIDIEGRSFVGYYTKLGDAGGSVSMSIKQDRLVRHAGLRQTSAELDSIERQMLAQRSAA